MAAVKVAIVDSGGANIASLRFALERIGVFSTVTRDADKIRNSTHVVLPGVGAAQPAMSRLHELGLHTVIPTLNQPVLGICLGMQLLATRSGEDDTRCLGVFDDTAYRLPASPSTPVPNMGWCQLSGVASCSLLDGIPDGEWFYFVHSYALPVGASTVASATHSEPFSAVLAKDNFYATQFHPERSATAGARLLENFTRLTA